MVLEDNLTQLTFLSHTALPLDLSVKATLAMNIPWHLYPLV